AEGGKIGKYLNDGDEVNANLIISTGQKEGIVASGANVFFVDPYNNRISQYSSAGDPINPSLVTGLSDGRGMAIGSESLALVRSGDSAPDVAGAHFLLIHTPAMNDNGFIAFWATVAGSGITSANNAGIWAQDRFGILHVVCRTGFNSPD